MTCGCSPDGGRRRGQSHVVGIALLLGITVLALAGLTAGIGSVVDSSAAAADAERVADGIDAVHTPTQTAGTERGTVHLAGGTLRAEERTIDLYAVNTTNGTPPLGTLDPDDPALQRVEQVETDALRYETDRRTVTALGGAILVGGDGGDRLYRPPSINGAGDERGPLLVGLPAVDADDLSISSRTDGTRVRVTATVEHERQVLSADAYRIAVETERPGAWIRFFENEGVAVETIDDDDGTVVVAQFAGGDRPAYLVVHRSTLEVTVA